MQAGLIAQLPVQYFKGMVPIVASGSTTGAIADATRWAFKLAMFEFTDYRNVRL